MNHRAIQYQSVQSKKKKKHLNNNPDGDATAISICISLCVPSVQRVKCQWNPQGDMTELDEKKHT